MLDHFYLFIISASLAALRPTPSKLSVMYISSCFFFSSSITNLYSLSRTFWNYMLSRMSVKCLINSAKSISPSPLKSADMARVTISSFVKLISGHSVKHCVYSEKSNVPFMFLSYFLKVRNSSIESRCFEAPCLVVKLSSYFIFFSRIFYFITIWSN